MKDVFLEHELLDRVWSVREMFDTLVLQHPAADLCSIELTAAFDALSLAYDAASQVRFGAMTGEYEDDIEDENDGTTPAESDRDTA